MTVLNDINSVIRYRVYGLLLVNRMSQKELAEMLGVHKATLNGYLRGRTCFPLDVLVFICDIFGVSLDYLCGRDYD